MLCFSFDFKLIKTELFKTNCFLPDDLSCADSLLIFDTILKTLDKTLKNQLFTKSPETKADNFLLGNLLNKL